MNHQLEVIKKKSTGNIRYEKCNRIFKYSDVTNRRKETVGVQICELELKKLSQKAIGKDKKICTKSKLNRPLNLTTCLSNVMQKV